jgi:aminoglycoside phosphotransferase (APT) family kinase protein
MCDAETGALTAVIDWGDATLGDPARDFAAMPLQCVPAMLESYGAVDIAFIARSLVVGLNVALWEVRAADIMTPERHWWRMPPGGWEETKSLIARQWPALA